jgi:hypothetical protein
MTFSDTNSAGNIIAQGSISIIAITFLNNLLKLMFPFLIVTIVLVGIDLYFGLLAAKKRGETIRVSRAIRRTVSKLAEYVCWVVLAASLAVAFKWPALNWIILAVVIGNELLSVMTNWLYIHNKKITGFNDFLLKLIGKKADIDTTDLHIEDVDDPKKQ